MIIGAPPLMSADAADYERMAVSLEATGEYRILRKMGPLTIAPGPTGPTKRAIFVDVETTGLDTQKDCVIELAGVPFDYSIDGTIVGIREPFGGLQDPGFSLAPEITALTGITDEMLRGSRIDPDEVNAFIEETDLVIAHNAAFDRPFCERQWSNFAKKPWACSLREIDWAAEGLEGRKLSQIAAGFGFYFDAHRASDDCLAGIHVLARRLPRTGRTGLAALLESARAPRCRLWAEGAPYASRTLLKSRGYRWNTGDEGGRRSWYIDVAGASCGDEQRFLRAEVFRRPDMDIPAYPITAIDRYSARELTMTAVGQLERQMTPPLNGLPRLKQMIAHCENNEFERKSNLGEARPERVAEAPTTECLVKARSPTYRFSNLFRALLP